MLLTVCSILFETMNITISKRARVVHRIDAVGVLLQNSLPSDSAVTFASLQSVFMVDC